MLFHHFSYTRMCSWKCILNIYYANSWKTNTDAAYKLQFRQKKIGTTDVFSFSCCSLLLLLLKDQWSLSSSVATSCWCYVLLHNLTRFTPQQNNRKNRKKSEIFQLIVNYAVGKHSLFSLLFGDFFCWGSKNFREFFFFYNILL